MISDEQLMEHYQLGDSKAFEALYARYEGKLMGYLRKKGVAEFEVEEIFQKIFIRFHETRLAYSPKHPVSAWFFTLARHGVSDHFRSQKSWAKTTGLNDDLPDSPKAETRELNLELLAPEEKELLQSRYLDQKTYEDISRSLGVSQSAVRKKVSRAVHKLRTLLSGEPHD